MRVVASCQLSVASGECARRARCVNRQRRTAFTLTEVMFAVILLGIGFIMVAAMFPVAIEQNRTTVEQTAATQLARAAVNNLQQNATDQTMPTTAGNVTINDELWSRIEGSLINADDPRYAWTALYARETDAQFAQVFIFTLQARNRPAFLTEDTFRPWNQGQTMRYPANLEPKPVLIEANSGNPLDQITIHDLPDNPAEYVLPVSARQAAAEGAHVVIVSGLHRGRVLRLGRPVNRSQGVWELVPGGDLPHSIQRIPALRPDDTIPPPAEAYIIGRGYAQPSTQYDQPPTFEGPAMDVTLFTGFVRVRQ